MKLAVNSLLVLPIAISLSSGASAADSSEWVRIANNSDGTLIYSGKKGSFELTTTKGGEDIAVIVGQTEDESTKNVVYMKWYVTTADCEAGLGKLVVLKVGGEYNFETDFVSGGQNIASGIADSICAVYRSKQSAKKSKSI